MHSSSCPNYIEQGIHIARSAAEGGRGSIPSISRYGAARSNIKDDQSKD
jgi:hypothetical protein